MVALGFKLLIFCVLAYLFRFLQTVVLWLFGSMAFWSGKRAAAMDGVIIDMRQLSVADLEDEVDDIPVASEGGVTGTVDYRYPKFARLSPIQFRRDALQLLTAFGVHVFSE